MKRAYADRAKYLGDPDFNSDMPIARLTSKDYAAELRKTINPDHTVKSSPATRMLSSMAPTILARCGCTISGCPT